MSQSHYPAAAREDRHATGGSSFVGVSNDATGVIGQKAGDAVCRREDGVTDLDLASRRPSQIDPFVELITVRARANPRADGRVQAIEWCWTVARRGERPDK